MVCFIASIPTKSLYRSNVPQRVYLMHVAAVERMHDIRSPLVGVWHRGSAATRYNAELAERSMQKSRLLYDRLHSLQVAVLPCGSALLHAGSVMQTGRPLAG
jgi:hypothetical protein